MAEKVISPPVFPRLSGTRRMKTVEYLYTSQHAEFRFDAQDNLCVSLSGNAVSLSERDLAITRFILRNLGASLDELFLYELARTHAIPSAGDLRSRVSALCEKGILDMRTQPMRLHIPHLLDHSCEMCGCSCMAQLVGPLSPEELANIHEAHGPLHEEGAVAQNVNPIMKGMKPDGTCMHFVHFPAKRCLFLDQNNLCTVHGKFGAMKKPAACRLFPHIAVETESELRIGIKPYCYANMRVCDLSEPPKGYAATFATDQKDFYDELLKAATKRPVLYRASAEEAAFARLQETALLDLLGDERTTLNQIIRVASGADNLSQPAPDSPLPPRFFKALHARFLNLVPALREEALKLGTTDHAHHAASLCTLLEKPLTRLPEQADPKFLSFVRYSLYNAVFLRETMRFPAFLPGVFALALGALAAIQDTEHPDTQYIAWMRLFAQTPAFTLLFDSPDAMTSLCQMLA